jgi:hypothetical protein
MRRASVGSKLGRGHGRALLALTRSLLPPLCLLRAGPRSPALLLATMLLALGWASPSSADVAVDRVVARFTAPEIGGVSSPRYVFERELAFEARLEALSDGSFEARADEPYLERHAHAALERHMAETLLEGQEIAPEPTRVELDGRVRAARVSLEQQVGGERSLAFAMSAEGIEPGELYRLLWRRARASLYLDRMVASMLTPGDAELMIVHRTMATPFSAQPYEQIAPQLRRWYIAQRLNTAVRAFYESARARITLKLEPE